MDNSNKWRSSIKPLLLRSLLLRGSLLGGAGALMLLLLGTFLPASHLKIWGLPILIVSLIFITIGLLPYRRMVKLETHPDELQIDEKNLLFSRNGKPLLQIPLSAISELHYIEEPHLYGLSIRLKPSPLEKVKVLQEGFDIENFISESRTRFNGCDIFLPYFSELTSTEINEFFDNS